jgi:N-acetylglucosamine kinase-like BadF-type ATPase
MTLILGVDGGNSKTLAAVGDESGRILGVGRSGSGSHQALGLEAAMLQIRGAADQALAMARVEASDVDAAYYCLAGADLLEDFDLLWPAVRNLGLGREVGLNNDSMASLRSGTDNPNAVVVALGSGTVAAGHNAAGREIRLPALGWISGDWGGGGDLARDAIWYSVRAHDGRGEPTALQDMILCELEVPDVDTLINRLYHREIDRLRILHLAPHVFEVAEAGDKVARYLVEEQAKEVVITAVALLRRLGILETPSDVVLGGSIFKARSPLFMNAISERLGDLAPLATIVRPNVEPAVGSYFCGMDLLHIAVQESIRNRARESYDALMSIPKEEVASP